MILGLAEGLNESIQFIIVGSTLNMMHKQIWTMDHKSVLLAVSPSTYWLCFSV